jgi:hypothetical protein
MKVLKYIIYDGNLRFACRRARGTTKTKVHAYSLANIDEDRKPL